MTSRVLCRYFLHGACNRGSSCTFSHDQSDQPSNVCTFYLRGQCTFGDRCRYDHVKPPGSTGGASSRDFAPSSTGAPAAAAAPGGAPLSNPAWAGPPQGYPQPGYPGGPPGSSFQQGAYMAYYNNPGQGGGYLQPQPLPQQQQQQQQPDPRSRGVVPQGDGAGGGPAVRRQEESAALAALIDDVFDGDDFPEAEFELFLRESDDALLQQQLDALDMELYPTPAHEIEAQLQLSLLASASSAPPSSSSYAADSQLAGQPPTAGPGAGAGGSASGSWGQGLEQGQAQGHRQGQPWQQSVGGGGASRLQSGLSASAQSFKAPAAAAAPASAVSSSQAKAQEADGAHVMQGPWRVPASAVAPPVSLLEIEKDAAAAEARGQAAVAEELPEAERPLCSANLVDGGCTKGGACKDVHGDKCATCGKNVLHPARPEDATVAGDATQS